MRLRADLLVASTVAILLHACLVYWGLRAHGLIFPITSVYLASASGQTSPQAWNFSVTQQEPAISETLASEELATPLIQNSQAQAHNPAASQNPEETTPEKVLFSTFTDGFSSNEYLAFEDIDTAAQPAANWILPLQTGYLDEISSIVVRVWIRQDGGIVGAELLDVRPHLLDERQMQEIVDWLASTPMFPAIKNGTHVASKRTLEIVFEH
jgi:hypothetical protein